MRSNTNVHSVRPRTTRHRFIHSTDKDPHRAAIVIVMHLKSEITILYCIKHQYHVLNLSNIDVRTVCPGPTRHDTHSIHSANKDQRRAVITSAVYTRVILRRRTASNTKKTAIQTYALFVHSQRGTRFIHSTHEDQRTAVHRSHCSVFGQHMRMRLRPYAAYSKAITPSNSSTQQCNVRAVRPGPTWHPFHTFNEQRLT